MHLERIETHLKRIWNACNAFGTHLGPRPTNEGPMSINLRLNKLRAQLNRTLAISLCQGGVNQNFLVKVPGPCLIGASAHRHEHVAHCYV